MLRCVLVAVVLAVAPAATPQRIGGGSFQASAVVHVPGSDGVLFVDDDTTRAMFWMQLTADGRQRGRAVRVPLPADVDVTDMEGLTTDGTYFYAVGSQSKRTGFEGDGLIRFRFDARQRTISDVERIRDLKRWLAEHVAELRGTERRVGDEVLNIEAIAWDPGEKRLLLGLRAPVVDGQALVVSVRLRNDDGPLAADNLDVDGDTIRLPLGGAGIRGLEWDPEAKRFWVIAGAERNAETRDFRILAWDGDDDVRELRELARYPRTTKPEGIARATIAGRAVSVVVFDTGRFVVTD